ncbi:MAG: hypothetical protein SFU83_22410 [Meiothermus sp.]|nr:hypothetical protein [Meiothermus sp.]
MSPIHELLYQSQSLFWWVFPIAAGVAAAVFGAALLTLSGSPPPHPPSESPRERQQPRT